MQVLVRSSLLFVVAALITACAAHRDPIVDMQGVDPDALARDWQECEAYTEEIALGEGVARGSATGAAVGAVVGVINGDVGRSAANGALYGGTKSGLSADKDKRLVFKRCLSGRGYRVLN